MAGSPRRLEVILLRNKNLLKFLLLYQKSGGKSKISMISFPLFSGGLRAGHPEIMVKSLEFRAALWY